ncbi:MAG: hypothetical protein ACUVXI_11465 [bacterium]
MREDRDQINIVCEGCGEIFTINLRSSDISCPKCQKRVNLPGPEEIRRRYEEANRDRNRVLRRFKRMAGEN